MSFRSKWKTLFDSPPRGRGNACSGHMGLSHCPLLEVKDMLGPFFHDNRAETLEAVFRDVGHQLDRNLSDDELRDLVAFLNGL